MNDKVLITQSNYIPWKGYFDNINAVDTMVIYDDMQYTKRDWRNRNLIKTSNGLKWLSIPVNVKGKYDQKINEVEINNPDWKINHWNQLYQNYKNSQCFNEMELELKSLYLNNSETKLSNLNQLFIEKINSILGIKTKILRSEDFKLKGDKTEKLVNICLELGAKEYFTGPAAKNYIQESLFIKNSIKVKYFDYANYPEYNQLFGEFEHGVSILDLLFNTGKNTSFFMKTF